MQCMSLRFYYMHSKDTKKQTISMTAKTLAQIGHAYFTVYSIFSVYFSVTGDLGVSVVLNVKNDIFRCFARCCMSLSVTIWRAIITNPLERCTLCWCACWLLYAHRVGDSLSVQRYQLRFVIILFTPPPHWTYTLLKRSLIHLTLNDAHDFDYSTDW